MIQPGEIQNIAGKEGVRDTQIEKDYVISWVTYGIANNQFLNESLVFKGGTVLKKANQMTEIPDFNDVWRELGKHWRKFQKFIE